MYRLLLLPLLLLTLFASLSAGRAVAEVTAADTAAGTALTHAEAQAVIQLLEDAGNRDRLLEKLKAIAAAQAQPEPPPPTLARHIAEVTRAAAESSSGFLARLASDLHGLGHWELRQDMDLEAVATLAGELVAVIVVTILVFLLLRLVTLRLTGRLAAISADRGVLVSAGALLICLAIDAAAVVAAWALGYLAAVGLIGSTAEMAIEQSLYLNAFLIIGLAKVAMNAILSPRHASLRIPPISDLNAAYWYHWFSRIAAELGYGFLFVVPIVNAHLGPAVGRSLQVLVALTALAMAILLILQSRKMLSERQRQRASQPADFFGHFLGFVARYWHVGALVYVCALFVIWLSRPEGALAFILVATAKSAVAILIGFLATAAMSRAIAGGLHLPQDVKERLPLLELRLNAFVPKVLRVIRAVVFLFVAAAILESWETVDVSGWLASEFGQAAAASIVSAILILVISWLAWLGMSSWVEYRLNPNVGTVPGPREKTLLQLLRNAATVVIAALAVMLALSELGVNIGPLLAGAGVLGLAIGFGAQKLVQDVITGVFIQFDNAINEGDVVTVGGTTGVVEKLTIRSVCLRDLAGTYHIMPFSAVDRVSNFNRDFGFHVAAIGVAYRENIAEVKEAMQEAFALLQDTDHAASIIGDLEMHGVTEFGDSAIVVRARIRTLPGTQWAIGRAYNEFIKTVFDRRNIEIPFPHQTIYFGEDKSGNAPALHLARQVPKPADPAAPAGTPAEPAEFGTDAVRGTRPQSNAPPAAGSPLRDDAHQPEDRSADTKKPGPAR